MRNLLGRQNGNVLTWCVFALLVRAPIDGIVEKVGADPAIVEQSVSFARRPVAGNALAFVLERDQKRQEFPLRGLYLLTKASVGLKTVEAEPNSRARNAWVRSLTGFEYHRCDVRRFDRTAVRG